MFVFCLLILIIAVYGLIKCPHTAILIYAICSIFLQDYICLRFEPPAVMLRLLLDVLFIGYFIIKRKFKFYNFPLKKLYYYLFFTIFIGVLVSPMSVTQTIPAAVGKITPYLIVVLFYGELKSVQDLRMTYRVVIISYIILCAYAFVEFLLQMNPVGEYIMNTIPEDLLRGKIYVATEYRYFSLRCSSLLAICISWGGYCCLITSCFLCISNYRKYDVNALFMLLLLGVLAFNVLISGSRSPMIYFAIVIVGIFLASKNVVKITLLLAVVGGFILNHDLLLPVLSSLSGNNDEVSGSSVEMRLEQMNAVMAVISGSPIWGFGIKGYEFAKETDSDILGAESIWFQQLISGGLLGIIYQISFFWGILKLTLKSFVGSSKLLGLSMVVGWIAFTSLTSSPGLKETYFLTIVFFVIRYVELHNNNNIKV